MIKQSTKRPAVMVFILILLSAIAVSSCKSKENCAAYGEAKKYQIEKRR